MTDAPRSEPGIYWQSRMGNNHDGIGGNCHRYDIVGDDGTGAARRRLVVDFGIKLINDDPVYDCSFPSPAGLFPRRDGIAEDAGPPAEALLLTHCHEDHIGGLRHAIDLGYRLPPVHCTAFTAEMLRKSLRRAGIVETDRLPEIHVVQSGETVRVAGAEVTFVPVDHLPGAAALVIRSPEAAVFHTGDYKFDSTLPLGTRSDPGVLQLIGQRGIDMVVSDSTASGDTSVKVSEAEIERNLTRLVADQNGRAVVAGLLGTQLDRLVSLGRAAARNGRQLVIDGASLLENVRAAERAGLDLGKAIGAAPVPAGEARQIAADRALVATTGAFAQPGAGLTRAAEQQPGALYIGDDTTVIIPQRAIPPIAAAHREMVERIERLGARVITAERAQAQGFGAIHQSGHAIASDTKLLYALLKPRGVVSPMHGAPPQIEANAAIARSLGVQPLALSENGMIVRVNRQGASVVGSEEMHRFGAARTELAKKLPRAKPGEGRSPPPPPVYRYDRFDGNGTVLMARDIVPYAGPTRPAAARMRNSGR